MAQNINILYYGRPRSGWEEYFCLSCKVPIETLVCQLSKGEHPKDLEFMLYTRHSSLRAAKTSVRSDGRVTLMARQEVVKIKVQDKYLDASFMITRTTP